MSFLHQQKNQARAPRSALARRTDAQPGPFV